MHTGLLLTFKRDTGAGSFGQAVNIIGFDAQRFFYVAAHFFCPWFSTKNTGLQVDIIRAKSHLLNAFANKSSIRRCAAQNGSMQVTHELDLAIGIARRHGQSKTTNLV